MPTTFSRTLRSLETDSSRGRGGVLLAALLLLGGSCWLVFGRVTVYEQSASARLEVQEAAHPVSVRLGGKVANTYLTLGREVVAGDVLVELDSEAERLEVAERRARLVAAQARLLAIVQEIKTEQQSLEMQTKARTAASDEATALLAEAAARTRYADLQVEALAVLRRKYATSELEYRKGVAEADASHAAEKALTFSANRLRQDRLTQESERRTRLAKLRRETVELEGEAAVEEAGIRRLEHAVALRVIRAPVGGRVGEALELRVGTVVRDAEKLASIVPEGNPRVVGLFPAASVGRIRPEQEARVRLDGFPWTQYGTLPATVGNVGNEASGGLIRVEFILPRGEATAVPLEHGLSGTVEVAVERVSPAVLVLRAAGHFLTGKPSVDVGTGR